MIRPFGRRRLGGHRLNPRSFRAFPPDGRFLALVGPEGTLHLAPVAGGKEWWRREGPETSPGEPGGPSGGQDNVVFAADGRTLAAEGAGGCIHLWETATGRERRRFAGHEGGVRSLAFSPDGRRLLSGGADTTAVVWDVTGLAGRPAGAPSARELGRLWEDLAGEDAAPAYRAVWALALSPRQSVGFLAARLRPVPPPSRRRLRELVGRLASHRYADRARAAEDLWDAGEAARPVLRQALAHTPSVEVRRRLEQLLAKLDQGFLPAGQLRAVRAVEALERAGTPQARRVLRSLAGGSPEARVTQEAELSLRRLEGRPPPSPRPVGGEDRSPCGRDAAEEAVLALDQTAGALIERAGPDQPVTGVSFGFDQQITPSILAHLRRLPDLRSLGLSYTRMDDSGLASLEALKNLRQLSLGYTRVTDAGLAHLRDMTRLEVLHLGGTRVTDAGLKNLEKLALLRTLDLSQTRVGDAGLAHLRGLKALAELNLSRTRVSDAGLAHLRGLTGLRHLDLQETAVRGPGLAHLGGLTRLRLLQLRGSQVTARGLQWLPAAARLRWVDVSNTPARREPLTRGPGGKVRLSVRGQDAWLVDAAGKAFGARIHHDIDRQGARITGWAFSPDGKRLATGASYESDGRSERESLGQVRVWDAATGELVANFPYGVGAVRGLAFGRDGKTVLFQAEPRAIDGP